jgi:DNA polymerase-3 subunit gamma/tau
MFADQMRPQTFEEVIGNDHIKSALKGYFAKGNLPHTILLDGQFGSGKTTIARLIAAALGSQQVTEHDCGANGDINTIREIVDNASYTALWGETKVIILDEVHKLSKAAQDVLLKTTEEPVDGTYFILCTSQSQDIIAALRSRCVTFTVKPVDVDGIRAAYKRILSVGKLVLEGGTSDWDSIIAKSEGSLRVVYNMLDKVYASAEIQPDGSRLLSTATLYDLLGLFKEEEFDDTQPLPKAVMSGNTQEALNAIAASRKDKKATGMGTMIGLYNYLKKAQPKKFRGMLTEMAFLLLDPEKANNWYALEYLVLKYVGA